MPDHGTNASYVRGCRCDDCRAAHAAYQRDWAARNPDKAQENAARKWRNQTPEQRERRNAYMREYMATQPEQRAKKNTSRAAWRGRDGNWEREREALYIAWKRDPSKRALVYRKHWLKKTYGLTLDDFDAMVEAQDGRCAICRREQVGMRMHIDHNHDTGKVRGILCSPCNTALGLLGDDPERVFAAADYLLHFNEQE